ncbi:MAG: hypothetical protein ABIP85_25715 [Chthoniobacteraceae bacterium]
MSGPGSTFLTITGNVAGSGVVTLTDCAAQTAATGSYSFQSHLFQTAPDQLPMPIHGTEPTNNNVRWGWLLPGDGRPATIRVAGEVWGFTGSDAGGDHYAGYYTGQQITIGAPGTGGAGTVGLDTAGSHYDGIFTRGGFLMNGGPVVGLGNASGTATGPSDGLSRLQSVVSDLDIGGNVGRGTG